LDILDAKYYDEFNHWRDVCFILKKYEQNTHKPMFDLFNNFSKKSNKYDVDGVKNIWNSLNNYDIKMNLGSLYFYAKESNITGYKDTVRFYHQRIKIDITNKYLAHKIKELAGHLFFFKNETLYSFDIQHNFWYEDKTEILKRFINNELYDHMSSLINDAIEDREYYDKMRKELRRACITINGQKALVETFHNEFFNEICDDVDFDAKHYLLAFNNGVWDLMKKEFRQIRYDDYITVKTGYNYQEPTKEQIETIEKILYQIESDKEKQKLLKQILATGLIGKSYQKFIIFNGVGGNGKSFLDKLMEISLGNYFYKGKIDCLCEKASSGASPELAHMHKKRYIVFSEPEAHQKIKNGRMKEWTGDGKINGRMLFSSNVEVKMYGTLVLCCNDKIQLEGEASEGEIRRMIDFLFESRFLKAEDHALVDEANRMYKANKTYENSDFQSSHRFAFLKILIDEAHKFLTEDDEEFKIPQCVKKRTDEYLSGSYVLINLLKDVTEKTNNKEDIITIGDLYDKIKRSDFYITLTKDEKRKMNKKNMIDFYRKNKFTANFYKDEHRPYINGKQIKKHNALIGFKFTDEEEKEEDICYILDDI
jgi:phage/plasmid-associated DNA primase